MMFKDECEECGQIVAAEDPTLFGFVMAVHLHDEHSEAFEERAEEARTMLEIADDEFDDASMGPLASMVQGVFGG